MTKKKTTMKKQRKDIKKKMLRIRASLRKKDELIMEKRKTKAEIRRDIPTPGFRRIIDLEESEEEKKKGPRTRPVYIRAPDTAPPPPPAAVTTHLASLPVKVHGCPPSILRIREAMYGRKPGKTVTWDGDLSDVEEPQEDFGIFENVDWEEELL